MSVEREFKVGKHVYRAGRLSVFDQMNLAMDFRDALIGLAYLEHERPKDLTDEAFRKAMEFIFTAGGRAVPPDVRERVTRKCLSVVQRMQQNAWAPLMTAEGAIMFDDLALSETIEIVYNVLVHNGLVDFFYESPSSSGGQTAARDGQPSREGSSGSSRRSSKGA